MSRMLARALLALTVAVAAVALSAPRANAAPTAGPAPSRAGARGWPGGPLRPGGPGARGPSTESSQLGGLGFSLFQFKFIEPRPQDLHRYCAVLML